MTGAAFLKTTHSTAASKSFQPSSIRTGTTASFRKSPTLLAGAWSVGLPTSVFPWSYAKIAAFGVSPNVAIAKAVEPGLPQLYGTSSEVTVMMPGTRGRYAVREPGSLGSAGEGAVGAAEITTSVKCGDVPKSVPETVPVKRMSSKMADCQVMTPMVVSLNVAPTVAAGALDEMMTRSLPVTLPRFGAEAARTSTTWSVASRRALTAVSPGPSVVDPVTKRTWGGAARTTRSRLARAQPPKPRRAAAARRL